MFSEGERYKDCAGAVHRKCMERAENVWEHHVNDLIVFFANIDCYNDPDLNLKRDCNAPILKHMNQFVQAFKNHIVEKHGLLGNLMKEMEP